MISAQVHNLWFYFSLCWLLIRVDARPALFPLKSFCWWVFHHLWTQQQHEYQEKAVGRSSCHLFLFFYFFRGELVVHFHVLKYFLVRFPYVKAGILLTDWQWSGVRVGLGQEVWGGGWTLNNPLLLFSAELTQIYTMEEFYTTIIPGWRKNFQMPGLITFLLQLVVALRDLVLFW